MNCNVNARDAKRIIHEAHGVFKHIKAVDLPAVAKGYAHLYHIPQKAMLKAMARYIRINHAK